MEGVRIENRGVESERNGGEEGRGEVSWVISVGRVSFWVNERMTTLCERGLDPDV
jgi:hypothetical protein